MKLNKLHNALDYVPVVSNIKNILDLIVKKTSRVGQATLDAKTAPPGKSCDGSWSDFAKNKSDKKIAFLILVPIISNIALLIIKSRRHNDEGKTGEEIESDPRPNNTGKPPELSDHKDLEFDHLERNILEESKTTESKKGVDEGKTGEEIKSDPGPKDAKTLRQVRFQEDAKPCAPESEKKVNGNTTESLFFEGAENLPPSDRMKYTDSAARERALREARSRRVASESNIPKRSELQSDPNSNISPLLKAFKGAEKINVIKTVQENLLNDCYFYIISKFAILPKDANELYYEIFSFLKEKNKIEEEINPNDRQQMINLVKCLSGDEITRVINDIFNKKEAVMVDYEAFNESELNSLKKIISELCKQEAFRQQLQRDMDFWWNRVDGKKVNEGLK